MPTYRPNNGRHENGQNYLVNDATIRKVVGLVHRDDGDDRVDRDDRGDTVEIGPGHGALTFPLQDRVLRGGGGGSLTVVEIDPDNVRWLEQRLDPAVHIVEQDFLEFLLPDSPYRIVGNLPFHLTTAMLRRVLHAPGWTDAVVITQWEVARRRAGVGGATMMTAQWWPWITFDLHGRVPAGHFRPRPTVDGGVLVMSRRREPLLDVRDRARYHAFVHGVFTGKGHGIRQILVHASRRRGPGGIRGRGVRDVQDALREAGVPDAALPKELDATQWVSLFTTLCGRGPRMRID